MRAYRTTDAESPDEVLRQVKFWQIEARFVAPRLTQDFIDLAARVRQDPSLTLVWEQNPADGEAAFQVLPGRRPVEAARRTLADIFRNLGNYDRITT